MNTTPKKHTNLRQYKLLLEFLEKNNNIATASPLSAEGRVTVNYLWENHTVILNAAGPPVNSADKWKKVLKDWKYKLRSRVAANKLGKHGTGGGPSTEYFFTELEERLIELISVRETVDGVGLSFGAPIEPSARESNDIIRQVQPDTEDAAMNLSNSEMEDAPSNHIIVQDSPNTTHLPSVTEAVINRPQPAVSTRKRPMSKKSLLQKQVDIQEKGMKNINLKLDKIYRQNQERNKYLKKCIS